MAAVQPDADVNQRRHITIFFSDLSDSTRIAASMEPEDYADLLQKLRDLCEQIVPRHGGEIVRIDGDGVLCIFGYPIPYEDAGRRATEAAIDLHNAASTLDQSYASADLAIRLHTGIHAGLVLVRPGDLIRGRFEMLGDATNVAARLCDHASADEIVVSEATLGSDRPFFSTGPRRQVQISGRQHDLNIFSVFSREPIANRFAARVRLGVAPFAGRSEQMARLDALLAESLNGQWCVAVVAGPAGIGKTRTIGEFLDHVEANGAVVHRGYCEAYLGARPLQPFTQISHSLLTAGSQTGDVGLPPGLDTLIPVIEAALRDAQSQGPVILWIDDWQWADDASRQLFEALCFNQCVPLLFILSTRHDDPAQADIANSAFISMPPLTSTEAGAAIEGLLAMPEPFLVERIISQAGGSPLHIEELCHALMDGKNTNLRGDRGAWLEMLIQARFARLPPEQSTLVKTAAVIGHMIPKWLFEDITGLSTTDLTVRQLMADDFIYDAGLGDMLRFKHAITRDAIYRTVGLKERKAMHRRVADALQAYSQISQMPEQLEPLAYHHGASGNAERALHFAVLAGDAAMAVSALDRAQALYSAGFEALSSLHERSGLSEQSNSLVNRYGRACIIDPSRDQLNVLHAMVNQAQSDGNISGVVIARYWLGTVYYGLGDAHASIEQLDLALVSAAGLGTPGLTAHITAGLGQSHGIACNYPQAIKLIEAAISLKRPHWSGSKPSPGLAYLVATRGLLYADQGLFADGELCFARANEFLVGVEHEITASILGHQAAACLWQGNYADAKERAMQCNKVSARVKARYLFAMSQALAACAEWHLKQNPESIEAMIRQTAWLSAGASRQRISLLYGWLAEILVSVNRFEEARNYAVMALWRARDGDRLGEAAAFRALARIAATGIGKRSAEHYVTRALAAAARRDSKHERARTEYCAAALALARGAIPEAQHFVARARGGFAAMAMQADLNRAEALAQTMASH